MSNDQPNKNPQSGREQQPEPQEEQRQHQGEQGASRQEAPASPPADVDGLKNKKPEELTPEELRLMADTMPGEGPGD
ncbi:hypothetical protein [Massilia sp. DD77]|uniref:hypothetical protein n=1 Tax=Massilia sp. DD77 TaxID=3109349 RepID=UPI002FFDFA81